MAKIYVNTSILAKAANPSSPGHKAALKFLRECRDRGHTLVMSSIHKVEFKRVSRKTKKIIRGLMRKYGIVLKSINVKDVLGNATDWCLRRGYSKSRIFDVAHLLAAKKLGCSYIAAVDRFIKSHAKEFNLRYVNYYTGAP